MMLYRNEELDSKAALSAKMKRAGKKLRGMCGKIVGPSDAAPSPRPIVGPSDAKMKGKMVNKVGNRGSGKAVPTRPSGPSVSIGKPQDVVSSTPDGGVRTTNVGGRGGSVTIGPATIDPPSARMSRSLDSAGRTTLSKGLYSFKHCEKDAKLPAKYMMDYLCSFIEEAYEHEAKEPEHKNNAARDQVDVFARAVMGELLQTMLTNPNLRRAATKFNINEAAIVKLLDAKGIIKTKSDTMWTDSDSVAAMGGLALAGESMAYSQEHNWQQGDAYAVGVAMAPAPVDNVAHLVHDDAANPVQGLHVRKAIEMQDLHRAAPSAVVVNVQDGCPVHDGRDVTKAQNLHNPMTPCTCRGSSNAYG